MLQVLPCFFVFFQDSSVDMTEQQKAKEQTKLLAKFKQMRQLQLQQQDKLIQQQQQQLDALRQEQQRVQHMLAKQRDAHLIRKGTSMRNWWSVSSHFVRKSVLSTESVS
jgi:uncharacterized protein HemX